MSDGSKDFALGLLIGGLIGAAVALLYAPMAGVDTRRRVGEKAGELAEEARTKASGLAGTVGERAGEVVSTVRDRTGDWAQQARTQIDELRGRVTAAVEAGRGAMQEKQEELEQRIDNSASPAIPPETA